MSKLLNEIKSTGGAQAYLLQRYIITMCVPKMLRRLTHPTLAKPFYDSLKKVSTVDISQLLAKAPAPGNSDSKADKIFLTTTSELYNSLHVQLPNLLKQATAAAAGKPYNAYNKDTCIEFHELLCELLERFEEHLNKVATYLAGEMMDKNLSYKAILIHAIFYGEALHRLARSNAITRHLQAIEPLLADTRHDKMGNVKVGMTGNNEEEDAELARVQPSAIQEGGVVPPVWRSHLDWLKLMTDYFHAVLIVGDHMSGPYFPYSNLSIKILHTPPVSDAMLPWRNFLQSQHFPDMPAQHDIDSLPLPCMSVSDLIDKLDAASRSDRMQVDDATDLHHSLHAAADSSLLFAELRQDPLAFGIGFHGSRHCEMDLASFIYLSRTLTSGPIYEKYKHVLDQLSVSDIVFIHDLDPSDVL